MNKSTLAIAIGLLLVANTGFAKTTKMTLEQRLEQLESRLEAAENRADRAERLLHIKRMELRALGLNIEQARSAVEQARQNENRQQAELTGRYQGQVVSPRTLSGWDESQRQWAAQTAQQASALQALLEQPRVVAIQVESARQSAGECQRKVEKLLEWSMLLAEEAGWLSHQE